MLRLGSAIYSIAATVLIGVFMVIALVLGYDTAKPILITVALGLIAALPLAYNVTAKMMKITNDKPHS